MQTEAQGLAKAERLGSKEIECIFETGFAGKSHFFIARCLPNGLPHGRIAPIVGKKSGKAFRRNKIKRLIRQLYRTHKPSFRVGFDYAFIARAGVDAAPQSELLDSLVKAAGRACAECDRSVPRPAESKSAVPPEGAGDMERENRASC